jgi:hypothetical protein
MQVGATVAPTDVSSEYLPAAQPMQVLDELAATVVEYVPHPQPMHVLDEVPPNVVEYEPAQQL